MQLSVTQQLNDSNKFNESMKKELINLEKEVNQKMEDLVKDLNEENENWTH